MWFSVKGVQDGGYSFPYNARSPVNKRSKLFESIDDVHKELELAYNEATEKGFEIGEALYLQHFFFANSQDLVNSKAQDFIKQYQYCKDSGTPPFKTLQETPADYIDDWEIVKYEINCIVNSESEKAKNGNK